MIQILQIYRDFLKAGAESAYDAVEREAARAGWAHGTQVFAARPQWSAPSPDWITADRTFWDEP